MQNRKNNLLKVFIIIIVFVFAINIGIITASKKIIKQKVDAALEVKRPAELRLTIIKDSSCNDCADITSIIDAIKKTNAQIINEETFDVASQEAKNFISELEIKKLPTFIIKGEVNKNADVVKLLSQVGEIKNEVFKLTYEVLPYLDLASNTVKGKVTVTYISDKSCAGCYDLSPFKQILENNLGMVNPTAVSLDRSDSVARSLISKYKIEAAPMIILSGEVSEYSRLTGIWLELGTLEKDGAWVLRNIGKLNSTLIYRNLKTGKIIKPEAAVQSPVVTPAPVSSPAAK